MSDYSISEIRKNDRYAVSQMDALLKEEGIRRDGNLDYSCGLYDEDYELVGTGSCFGNTLRCLAVSHAHQGEGLMNEIVTHLINVQFARGNTHLFVYTKCSSAKFFADLGFREIVRIEDQVVFMENSWSGFDSYLKKLKEETDRQTASFPELPEKTEGRNRPPDIRHAGTGQRFRSGSRRHRCRRHRDRRRRHERESLHAGASLSGGKSRFGEPPAPPLHRQ